MSQESAYFIVENISENHDVKEVKKILDQFHGIRSVSINPKNHLVAVDYDSSGISYEKIERSLSKIGHPVVADASNMNAR